jgi:mono/diheme cytochrome c family protein
MGSGSIALGANAQQGAVLAKRWCASCHVIAADQGRGNTQAPPFSEIAKTKDFEQARSRCSYSHRIRACRT